MGFFHYVNNGVGGAAVSTAYTTSAKTLGQFIGRGALAGAVGGFAGGFVGGTTSAWFNGASFGNGLNAGLQSGAMGAATGAILGGIKGGVKSYRLGGNIFHGGGITLDSPAIPGETVGNGSGKEEDVRRAIKMYNRELRGLRTIHAGNEALPEGYKVEGGRVYNGDGVEVRGTTSTTGFGKYDMYFYDAAFSDSPKLLLTTGHEMTHGLLFDANFDLALKDMHEYNARSWELDQANTFGVKQNIDYYKNMYKYVNDLSTSLTPPQLYKQHWPSILPYEAPQWIIITR